MNAREYSLTILEIEQADEPLSCHDMFEEVFCGVIRGDARGHDKAGPALGIDQLEKQFGKNRIGVHIAHSRQRKPPAGTHELTCRL